jgi:hypothetical protein
MISCSWMMVMFSILHWRVCVFIFNIFAGEEFSYSAILDDYQIIKELGVGGFGKVMLGRHKEDKKEVAIKFMDISENCNLITDKYIF